MAKVPYSAYTPDGKEESGFIDVSSNHEALRLLKEKELKEIEFHGDALFGVMRDDLEHLSEKELKQIAQLENRWQKEMHFGDYFTELLKNNFWAIMIGIAMFGYGYSVQGAWWMSFGVILATVGPFFGLWNYKLLTTYEALIKSATFGEWDKVYTYANKLKASTKKPSIEIEADSKIAAALAVQGKLPEALAQIEKHRDTLRETMPGMYEHKIATLYYLAGNYKLAYLYMKKAYETSGTELIALDYINAEIFYGDLHTAEEIFKTIDSKVLPTFARPYYQYLQGLIAYKKGDLQNAHKSLAEAYSGMLAYRKNPAVWTIQAIIAGTLAVVTYEETHTPCSDMILSDAVVSVLKIYAPKEILEKLQKYYPEKF